MKMSKVENLFAASHFIVSKKIKSDFTASTLISWITDNYFMFLSHRFYLLLVRHKINFSRLFSQCVSIKDYFHKSSRLKYWHHYHFLDFNLISNCWSWDNCWSKVLDKQPVFFNYFFFINLSFSFRLDLKIFSHPFSNAIEIQLSYILFSLKNIVTYERAYEHVYSRTCFTLVCRHVIYLNWESE